jgi:hypothetical protein
MRFLQNEMCQFFLFSHFLFSSVKFPQSHDHAFGYDAEAVVANFLAQYAK